MSQSCKEGSNWVEAAFLERREDWLRLFSDAERDTADLSADGESSGVGREVSCKCDPILWVLNIIFTSSKCCKVAGDEDCNIDFDRYAGGGSA